MLQIKQLNKAFSNKQIFKNFNYTLETHDHLLISGVSGSGKSTLAQIIAGLDSNYQGTLIYNDLELGHISQHKWMKHIQYVPQYHSSIFKETLFKRSSFGYHLFYLHLFSLLNMVFQIG